MAKTKISEFSSTPGNNTDIDSINIAEGCAPSGINNAIRELMAQLKDFQTGAAGDSFNGPIGTSTAAAGAFTTLSASGNVTLAALTSTRVPYASTGGLLVDSANMTFNGTRLTVADLADSGLTSGRVTYASTGGALVDSANLTFDGTTLTAAGLAGPFNGTVGATTASTGAFTTLTTSGAVTHNAGTANGVAYLNGSKVLTTGSALTFDGTGFGVGGAITNRVSVTVNTADTDGVRVTNSSSGGVASLVVAGANGNGISGWPNAAILESVGAGGLVTSAFNGPMIFQVNGRSEQMRLTSTGLGIGTSSPNARLAVVGGGIRVNGYSSNSAGDGVNVQIGTTGGVNYVQSLNGTGTNNLSIDANQITFRTGSYSTAATLDSSGNLLVGTTTAVGSGTNTTASTTLAKTYNWFAVTDSMYVQRSNNTDGTVFQFFRGSSNAGNISITTSTTAYNTSSDYRLKNSIAPMTGALAKVALLKPCTYKWNADGSDGEGFIAHELAEVVPQCVTGEKDAVDADGKPQYQGIDTSFLVATLTAAIQELKASLDEVKLEFDAYKATHP